MPSGIERIGEQGIVQADFPLRLELTEEIPVMDLVTEAMPKRDAGPVGAPEPRSARPS